VEFLSGLVDEPDDPGRRQMHVLVFLSVYCRYVVLVEASGVELIRSIENTQVTDFTRSPNGQNR
jgi:hypothetical protein